MIWTLIEVGGILFWLLLSALVVFEFICYEFERKVSGVVGLILFVAAIWLFGNFDLFGFIAANYLTIAMTLGGYFALGLVWGFIKWEFWTTKRRREFEEKKRAWLDGKGYAGNNVPDNLKDDWTKHIVCEYSTKYGRYGERDVDLKDWPADQVKALVVPKASKHKGRILYWMSYWPISVVWTLLRDVLREIWEFLYVKVGRLLQRRSEAQFKGVESEFSSSKNDDKDS